jgi:hypothetical protein
MEPLEINHHKQITQTKQTTISITNHNKTKNKNSEHCTKNGSNIELPCNTVLHIRYKKN